jgi:hypothetical protein
MIYEVSCHVPDNADADRRMQGIGGSNWYKSIDEVIRCIDAGDAFYVDVGGRRVRVITGRHAHSGHRYITTEGDGFPPNNLLRLQRCLGR